MTAETRGRACAFPEGVCARRHACACVRVCVGAGALKGRMVDSLLLLREEKHALGKKEKEKRKPTSPGLGTQNLYN